RIELIDHGVDRVLQLENFALRVNRDLCGKVAPGDCGGYLRDVADLRCEVSRHEVDRISKIFPDTGNSLDLRLPTQLAFGSDLARHTSYFRPECIELVDHRVDGR